MVICHAIKGKFVEKSQNFHPFPMKVKIMKSQYYDIHIQHPPYC